MAVLRVLVCCFLLLVVLFCMLSLFFYLREWYAKWRGGKELSRHLEKCEAIRKEMSEIRDEISKMVPDEELVDNEYQEHYDQLSKWETEENAACLALFWVLCNRGIEQRRLCPEQYERLDELQACLEVEDELVTHLKWIRRPYFLSRINYDYWQEYCRKLSNSVT